MSVVRYTPDAGPSRAPWADYDDADRYSVCSAASNETVDNLPGTGRTLGQAYNFVGRFVEMQLGKAAEYLGKGPRQTVLRIERRRYKPFSAITKGDKIEKDCRVMLKYAKCVFCSQPPWIPYSHSLRKVACVFYTRASVRKYH